LKMKVSLVLATYGRGEELGRCLESLAAQTVRGFEVLVMDQNPDDRLDRIIAEFRSRDLAIHHERLPRPGLSEARNRGIQIARGDIVGFPDDDCWYEPETLAAILPAFEADASLSGVIADWVEQTEGGGNEYGASSSLLSLAAWRDFRGGAASSISLFLKRDLLLALNGFDERLGVGKWYGAAEETDLVLRALASSARIRRAANARVHHAFSRSTFGSGSQLIEASRARARGTGAIYAKHELPTATIVRGLVAPVLKPLAGMRFGLPLQVGWAIASGRLEGMQRWRKEESR
jgi:glycosyltransferase involved in cell wall biosynthesis